jgi:hypothetical protein
LDAINSRVEAVRQGLATEEQLETQRYEAAKSALVERLEATEGFEEEFRKLSEENEKQHQERLTEIRDREEARRLGVAKVYRKLDLDATQYALSNLAALQEVHSRKAFEVGKAAAIAETLIHTYSSAQKTYDALASANVYVAAAAAAAVTVAGLARAEQIRSTRFGGGGGGGGGGAALPGADSGTPIAVEPANRGVPAQPPRNVTIVIESNDGQLFTSEQVRKLIDQINQESEYGATITVQRG